MYTPFHKITWVVLNICILFTKAKYVKCPIDLVIYTCVMFKRYINSKLWRYIACVLRSAVKFYEPFHTRVLQLSVKGCKCGTILGPSDWKGTNSDTTGSIYSDLSVKQSQCTRLLRKARGAEDYLNLDHYNFALHNWLERSPRMRKIRCSDTACNSIAKHSATFVNVKGPMTI